MNPILTEYGICDVPDVDTERTSLELPAPFSWLSLRQPVDYTDNLLGDRLLERCQGLILYGPSGCGKSVAGLQAAAEWAAGLDGLHIVPARALKTVVLQTEDSLNDTRESLKGILASSVFTPEKLLLVEQNLIILQPVPGGTGHGLAELLRSACREHRPDILHVNPLLAFCPGDPARELGGLLYQFVDPVLKENRVGFLGVHHTPKTNNRDTSGYGTHDHQYLAAGDARVANWPRAMIQIEPVAKGVYRFRLAKRGHRAGWTWDSEPTSERYFKHAASEVRWLDATPEDAQAAEAVESYRTIATVLPGAGEQGISRERVRQLAKDRLHIGKVKADGWLKLGIEDNIIERVENIGDNKRLVALFRQSGGSV